MKVVYLEILRRILCNQYVMMRVMSTSHHYHGSKEVLIRNADETMSLANSDIFSERKEPDQQG